MKKNPSPLWKRKRKQENKHMGLNFTSMLCLGYCQVSQTTFDILCFWLSDSRMSLKGVGKENLGKGRWAFQSIAISFLVDYQNNTGSSSIKKQINDTRR